MEKKMINLTINNIPVTVPEGTTILEAARSAGINVHPEQGCKTDKKPACEKQEKPAKTEKAEKNTFSGKSDKKKFRQAPQKAAFRLRFTELGRGYF